MNYSLFHFFSSGILLRREHTDPAGGGCTGCSQRREQEMGETLCRAQSLRCLLQSQGKTKGNVLFIAFVFMALRPHSTLVVLCAGYVRHLESKQKIASQWAHNVGDVQTTLYWRQNNVVGLVVQPWYILSASSRPWNALVVFVCLWGTFVLKHLTRLAGGSLLLVKDLSGFPNPLYLCWNYHLQVVF